jgi:hypothetical protein
MKQEELNKEIPEEEVQDNAPAEQTENVELDMKEHGDMEISTGGSKPVFEKVTKGVVINATMMTTKDRQESKDKEGNVQAYYPVYCKVEYSIDDQNYFENYGGGKLFLSESDKSKRFWVGQDSALGKLKSKLEEYFEFKGTVGEIPKLLIGKQVGIKTESTTVAGKEYKKNIIQSFQD